MTSEKTNYLDLPFLVPGQAQKHITYNETLQKIDSMFHLCVKDNIHRSAPENPAPYARYIVALEANDQWAGHDHDIASWLDDRWDFLSPDKGWLAWLEEDETLLVFNGETWQETSSNIDLTTLEKLGINAQASTENRLTVQAANTLLNHDGDDHRLKINKASVNDTSSLLFQSDWMGRAEFGLIGDNNFSVKVSGDGNVWQNALTIDSGTNSVGINAAPSNGALRIGGALQVSQQTNAFGSVSNYTAFVLGAPGSRGGLFSVARHDSQHEPFVGLCGWDNQSNRSLYLGGGNWDAPSATQLYFYTAASYDETRDRGQVRLRITSSGNTQPGADNAYSLGRSSSRWKEIYCTNGVINTSDARLKTDILGCKLGLDFIRLLRPVSYRWRSDGASGSSPELSFSSARQKGEEKKHFGLVAQEVQNILTRLGQDDSTCLVNDDDEPNAYLGLRYTELIAPIIKSIQELENRLSAVENR